MNSLSMATPFAKTEAALTHAEKYANDLITPSKPATSSSSGSSSNHTVHHHHYHRDPYCMPSWHFWDYPRQTVIINHPAPPHSTQTQQKKETPAEQGAVLAFIVGGIVTFTAAYFIGQDFANLNQTNKEIKALKKQYRDVKKELVNLEKPIKTVFEKEKKIIEIVQRHAQVGVILKTALLASALFLAVGGFFVSPTLMGIGIVGTLCSGAAITVRWGYFDTDKTLSRKAQGLLGAVQNARICLQQSTISDEAA
ncbi:MAG: hypothetical protein K2X08_03695, partial [Chlamydiales bacterium]|nr:hypothetical protein [Chlamydiales bacterium]